MTEKDHADQFDEAADRIDLVFSPESDLTLVDSPLHRDISAIAVRGRTMFAACDETASVERLLYDEQAGRFAGHENFPLGEVFDLPAGAAGEMDIEGLEIQDDWLWISGSHSLKRDDPDDEGLAGLDDIDWDINRGFLGRLPLLDRGDGVCEPVGSLELVGHDRRVAAALKLDEDGGKLRRLLQDDPLLGPYVGLPCKENGLDVEGLAAAGDKVWLGLRGPVLGSLAMIVELDLKQKLKKPQRLKPRKHNGKRYRLYAINLNGQAIRDLLFVDGALLLLSGATTDLEAMQSVYRIDTWPPRREVVQGNDIERLIDLPVVRGSDHAEGLALFQRDGETSVLIAYDSPDEDRLEDRHQKIQVDVFHPKRQLKAA